MHAQSNIKAELLSWESEFTTKHHRPPAPGDKEFLHDRYLAYKMVQDELKACKAQVKEWEEKHKA